MKKLAAVLLLLTLSCGETPKRALTEAELRMVATAALLTEWGFSGADVRAQTVETTHAMDGSMTVRCEYDSDLVPGAKLELFHISEAQIFTTEIEAERAFKENVASYRKGVERERGRYVHPAPELLKMGDQSYAAYMQHGKKKLGNIFVVRRGRVLHSLLISRVYFDDPEDVRRLFAPMVDAAKKYVPS